MILSKIGESITKKHTRSGRPIPPQEKLVVTLRFLITGESFNSLMYQFRISKSAISIFVPEVCEAIFDILSPEFLRFPETAEEWIKISEEFFNKWNFPNCFGATDGKHIALFHPSLSGSMYYDKPSVRLG